MFWSRRWLGLLAFTVVIAALCLVAAHWQYGRYHTKVARRDTVHAASAQAPVPVQQLATPGKPLSADDQYRLVHVTGTYDAAGQVLVRNPLGQSGFDVMTPLRLADGSRIFVNRGWVPFSSASASATPIVAAPPTGVVHAVVRLQLPQGSTNSAQAPSGQVFGFDVAAWPNPNNDPTYLTYADLVRQTPPDSASIQRPPPPDVSLGPHLLYTSQWILFAGLALIGYVLLLRREAETRAEAAAAPPPAPHEEVLPSTIVMFQDQTDQRSDGPQAASSPISSSPQAPRTSDS